MSLPAVITAGERIFQFASSSPTAISSFLLVEVNRIVYPFDRHREGVDQWNCITGCVSVGHAWEHTKTSFIPSYHKISYGLPKVQVLSCECRTFSCGAGVVCEACHTLEFDASSLNLPPHFYEKIPYMTLT